MAITQSMCNSFKQEAFSGVHNFTTDTLKIALYTSAATLSAATTVYTASGEASGTGYTAGGKTLTGVSVTLSGSVAIADFDDVVWAAATITAGGALIYNSSKANRAVAVFNFGSDKSSTDGDFTVIMPAATATTAAVRLA